MPKHPRILCVLACGVVTPDTHTHTHTHTLGALLYSLYMHNVGADSYSRIVNGVVCDIDVVVVDSLKVVVMEVFDD